MNFESSRSLSATKAFHFLSGGGVMGELMRSMNWEAHPMGNPFLWPQSLKTSLSTMLHAGFPTMLMWGQELFCFYNDAFRPSLGNEGKHPSILGLPAARAWQEIWHVIAPMLMKVKQEGVAVTNEDQLIPIFRNGRMEVVYWTYSYSPVFNEAGEVAGILVVCYESTGKVEMLSKIAEREETLAFVMDSAELGMWDLNPATNVVTANDQFKKWFGIESAALDLSLSLALSKVIDEDRNRVLSAINDALKPSSGGALDVVFRVADDTENKYRFLHAKGSAIFNAHDNIKRFSGILQDVTAVEEQRQAAEKRATDYMQLADALPALIWTTDGKGNRIFASRKWQEYTGIEPTGSEVFEEMVHPEDYERMIEIWSESLSTGKHYKTEARLKRKDGIYEWFYFNGEPIRDEQGNIQTWIGTSLNVNEEKKAQQELIAAFKLIKETAQRFRSMVENAPVGIAVLMGPELVFDTANAAYLEVIDKTRNETIGHALYEVLPETREAVDPLLKNVLETGIPYQGFEFPVVLNRYGKKETSYFNFEYQPYRQEDGNITGIIVVASEVTKLVSAKHFIAESERNFRSMVMQSPIAMTIFRGKDHIIELANEVMFTKIWRRKPEDVLGKKVLDVFPELRAQKYPELLTEVLQTGKVHYENESVALVQGDDGMRRFYLDFEYRPLFDPDGTVSGIMVTVTDETEKVVARKKLEDAEARLRLAADATGFATWEVDIETDALIYSGRMNEIFGYPPDVKITREQLRSHVLPEEMPRVNQAFIQALAGRMYQYDVRIMRKDQSIAWINTSGKIVNDDNGRPWKLVGTLKDVTVEKQHEQDLLESEAKFRMLADTMPQFVWTTDAGGKINYINQSLQQYCGISQIESFNEGLSNIIHPDEHVENKKEWEHAVRSGNDFIFEHRLRSSDGRYRWLLTRAVAQRDGLGNIQMWVGTSTDINDIKELEQQKDYFISVASHELKTPLTTIKAYGQILQQKYASTDDSFLSNALVIVNRQIIKLTKLVADLLDISKIKSGNLAFNKEYFAMNSLVSEVTDEIRHLNPAYNIQFHATGDAIVFADRERVGQVITNLLTNGVKYSPGATKIDVRSVIENNNVVVSVQDYGVGIHKSDQEKIFERFFRVEGRNEKTFPGFGIGLFIADEIIRRSNGNIGVLSEPGKGSTFYFSLPVHEII